GGRGVAVVERRRVDEGLEGGARLTLGGRRPVELALRVVAPADQGADRPVRPHRDQGALAAIVAGAVGVGGVGERLLGRGLERRIDRRLHDDVGLELANEVVEHVHDEVGHVVGRAAAAASRRPGRLGERELRVLG
ncbi:hypothetical protein QU39_00095, partial [Staphylococcus aureus]